MILKAKYAFFPLFYLVALVILNVLINGVLRENLLFGPFPFSKCDENGMCMTNIRGIFGSIILFIGGFLLFYRNMESITFKSNFLVIVMAALLFFISIIAFGGT